MNHDSDKHEQHEWIERTLFQIREGEASPEDVARLRELLMNDQSARRIYLRTRQLECQLETLPSDQLAPTKPSTEPQPAPRSRRVWSLLAPAAAAAAVVAMVWHAAFRMGAQTQTTTIVATPSSPGFLRDVAVATLHSSFEALLDGREALQLDEPLHSGTYTLERGSVHLTFGKGAEVVIEGPAVFDLIDPATMHLNRGSLWVHCPEQARGFLVRMPGGRQVVDLGTEFGARVDGEGTAEVKVIKGEVNVRDTTARVLDLSAGKAVAWAGAALPGLVNADSIKVFQDSAMLSQKVASIPPEIDQSRIIFESEKGAWHQSENWSRKVLPGSQRSEIAVINQSRVVQFTESMAAPQHPLDINVSNDSPGTLEISASMECRELRIATAKAGQGTVNQTGGSLVVTGSFVASAHGPDPAGSFYTLANGALIVGHNLEIGTQGPSQFTVQGDLAAVSGTSMKLGAGATLAFTMANDNVGAINLRDSLATDPQARLVIDGASYHGGPRSIPLVSCGPQASIGKFSPANVSITGFHNLSAQLVYAETGLRLELTRPGQK